MSVKNNNPTIIVEMSEGMIDNVITNVSGAQIVIINHNDLQRDKSDQVEEWLNKSLKHGYEAHNAFWDAAFLSNDDA